jgi:glycosyltransferase involved in cell wall biosynthesis
MLVSVVIPIYNSGESALVAIQSVLGQTGRFDYEIIVVDDFSKDDSVGYLKKNLVPKPNTTVKYIVHEVNKGAGAARNTGIAAVTGEYFCLLDSDDCWLPGKAESQVDFLEAHPDYVLVGCLTNMPGSFIPPFSASKAENIEITIRHQVFKNFFQPSTITVRTSQFKAKVTWPAMRFVDECNVYLQLAHYYRLNLQNRILVNYADGKRGYGFSGLSSRLKESQNGEHYNLTMAYKKKFIGLPLYTAAISLSYIKYLKRILIPKFGKKA